MSKENNNNFADAFKALVEISPKAKKGTDGIYNPSGVKSYFDAIGKDYNPLDGKKNRQILRRKLLNEIANFSAIRDEAKRKEFANKWLAVNKFIYKDIRVLVSGNAGEDFANIVNKFSAEIQKLTK